MLYNGLHMYIILTAIYLQISISTTQISTTQLSTTVIANVTSGECCECERGSNEGEIEAASLQLVPH